MEQKEVKALELNSPSEGAVAAKASLRVRVEEEQQLNEAQRGSSSEQEQQLNEMEWH